MPYLQFENRQYPLLEGETRVGGSETAEVCLAGRTGGEPVDAVITVRRDEPASVRRVARGATVELNGVALGTQPTPLFHGDRLEIDGISLLYGDEAQAGATRRIAVAGHALPPEPRPGQGLRSGGRIVSLTDGREYTVRADGLTLGREAGCDIVIAADEVSRRHARLELRPEGYVLLDTSTNGILVNGARMKESHRLAAGDTVRIGPEEFRFYADAAQAAGEKAAPPPPPPPVAAPPGPRAPVASPPAGALPAPVPSAAPAPAEAPAPVPAAAPVAGTAAASAPETAAAPGARRTVLASLEIINEGPSRGTRFDVFDSLTHVGRGAYNDIVIADESVSDSHAKLQRRESGWYVVDIESTNGTYVNGVRVRGEASLPAAADLRFGGVKLRFRTAAAPADAGGGTRVIVGYRPPTPRSADAVREATAAAPSGDAGEREGTPRALVVTVLLLAAAVIFLILRTLS